MNIDELYAEDPSARPVRRPRHATRVPDDVAEDIQRRMATMEARRLSNRHRCDATPTTPCTHPNHRRDADSLLTTDERHPGILDTLGLDSSFPSVTEAEKRTWLKWIGQSGPVEEQAA
jgi:hypothetical protein